ncbi:MAG TPA: hypothetical protein VH280_09680 [Verrucomicrobiae bacterium]|nr:hypothetical protein [Verrucomicrobiae bacterium]
MLHAVTFRNALIINGLQCYSNVIAGCGDRVAGVCVCGFISDGAFATFWNNAPFGRDGRPGIWRSGASEMRGKSVWPGVAGGDDNDLDWISKELNMGVAGSRANL